MTQGLQRIILNYLNEMRKFFKNYLILLFYLTIHTTWWGFNVFTCKDRNVEHWKMIQTMNKIILRRPCVWKGVYIFILSDLFWVFPDIYTHTHRGNKSSTSLKWHFKILKSLLRNKNSYNHFRIKQISK